MTQEGYQLDKVGMGRFLTSLQMQVGMREVAGLVAAKASADHPRNPKSTDHLADHYEVSSTSHGGWHEDRAAGWVTNSADGAVPDEIGWTDSKGVHHEGAGVLARAKDIVRDCPPHGFGAT